MFTNNQLPLGRQESSCCTTKNPMWCNDNNNNNNNNNAQDQIHQQQPNIKRMKIDDSEAFLVEELNELSVKQREKAYEELYGMGSIQQEETPAFVAAKLMEMNEALDNNTNKVPARQLRDYHKALLLWPNLKCNRDFKLMFLRADHHDGVKAAKRLVNYFTQKRILFGDSKLVKKITMDDLTADDIQIFKSGFTMEITNRDRSGRPIQYGNLSKFDTTTMSVESACRAFWYCCMAAFTETEVAQRKGVCQCLQIPSTTDYKASAQLAVRFEYMQTKCLPGRVTAFHCLYDQQDIRYWVNKYLPSVIGQYSRMRFRGHLGSDIEMEYELLQLGISLDGLLQKDANGDVDSFNEYVTRRTEIDIKNNQKDTEEAKKIGYVEYPHPSDALIGRGRPYREWKGSKSWNDIVDKYAVMFKVAQTRDDRSCASWHVIEEYKSLPNSRFLLEPIHGGTDNGESGGRGGGWKVMDLSSLEAKEKAAVALRNRVKALKREAT